MVELARIIVAIPAPIAFAALACILTGACKSGPIADTGKEHGLAHSPAWHRSDNAAAKSINATLESHQLVGTWICAAKDCGSDARLSVFAYITKGHKFELVGDDDFRVHDVLKEVESQSGKIQYSTSAMDMIFNSKKDGLRRLYWMDTTSSDEDESKALLAGLLPARLDRSACKG